MTFRDWNNDRADALAVRAARLSHHNEKANTGHHSKPGNHDVYIDIEADLQDYFDARNHVIPPWEQHKELILSSWTGLDAEAIEALRDQNTMLVEYISDATGQSPEDVEATLRNIARRGVAGEI